MKAYEAVILASTLPCIRRHFSTDSGADAGCLLTNMGRVIGMPLWTAAEQARLAYHGLRSELASEFPVLAAVPCDQWTSDTGHFTVAMGIARRYDQGQSPDEIAAWLRSIETGAIGLGVPQVREGAEVTV